MTDAEIIKALEECTGVICLEISCDKCPNNYGTCKEHIHRKALDLINRLQAKNKEFDEKLIIQKGLIDTQKAELDKKDTEINILIRKKETLNDEISELKAEIERLEGILDRRCDVCPAVTTALNEFATRLKGAKVYSLERHEKVVSVAVIDWILKEMTEQ
jgi:chromosome segregation ATPase